MSLSDLFILANSGSFSELEQEKSMPNGGILRQCLRLSMKFSLEKKEFEDANS